MNIRPNRSKAASISALLLIFTLSFSLTACSGQGGDQFRPHPPRGSKSELTRPEEPAPPSEETTSPPSSPAETSSEPTFLYPNGQEVTLTPPGTELAFGQTALISTTDSEGRYLVWAITMHDKVTLPVENVKLLNPEDYVGVTSFACFAYDITFIGAVSRYTENPMVLMGIPDIAHAAVTPPEFLPGNSQRRGTVRVEGGVDNACGIPEETRLPTNESQLITNFMYARGTIGADRGNSTEEDPLTVIHEVNRNPNRTFTWK